MISIIIVNYNQRFYTEQCVRSIYRNFKSHPFEVIVINNSPEDDLSDLAASHKNLKLIQNENMGFSQANNLGVKHADGEYIFFLNADTVIKTDFLERFIMNFSDKDFGAVGMKLYNADRTFQLSFWEENTFWKEMRNKDDEKRFREKDLTYMKRKENEFREISEVHWVTGAAMIVRKEIFRKSGGFDERFFLFYEDADLCQTFKKTGHKNYFFPFSKIIHYKGENVNPEFQNKSYYHSKDSQLIYYNKHNSFFDNALLRVYLTAKFSLLYAFTFKKINLRILKRVWAGSR